MDLAALGPVADVVPLSHNNRVIVNVVRCFDDPNVVHVNGRVDPIADIETIVFRF